MKYAGSVARKDLPIANRFVEGAMGVEMTGTKQLQGIRKVFSFILLITAVVFVFDIPLYLSGASIFPQQFIAFFWSLVTILIFLLFPRTKKAPTWFDWLLSILTLVTGLYVTIFYPQILYSLALTTPFRVTLGVIAVFIVLESIRRVAGWPIVIIIVVGILYAKFGNYAPGILQTKGASWSRLFTQLYLGADFMLGIPLAVSVNIVFVFILFGQIIFTTGGGEFLIKLAMALMGRYRGGPAKVAVIASSLFGMISGSAAANVSTTGVITIPLMKRVGFSPVYAGAIEAVASTGGQILPPVMGAAAFIMAEFLNMSYVEVAIAAAVPALFYYLALYLQVDFCAAKLGLRGLSSEAIPSILSAFRGGWLFIIPFFILIYTLFFLNLSPGVGAMLSIAAFILMTLPKREIRAVWAWKGVVEIAQSTSSAMFELVPVCAGAGLIIGVVSYSGLGLSLARVLTDMAGGSLLLLALLAALASLILGMGMPTAGAYILLAVLVAPAFTKLGVDPITGHMFVLYFGVLSMITPPICIAVYAAATLATAPAMQVAIQSIKLAVAAFIVPFIFIFRPGVLLIGSLSQIVADIALAVAIIVLFAVVIEGHFIRSLRKFERGLVFVCLLALFTPHSWVRVSGALVAFFLLAFQLKSIKRFGRKITT